MSHPQLRFDQQVELPTCFLKLCGNLFNRTMRFATMSCFCSTRGTEFACTEFASSSFLSATHSSRVILSTSSCSSWASTSLLPCMLLLGLCFFLSRLLRSPLSSALAPPALCPHSPPRPLFTLPPFLFLLSSSLSSRSCLSLSSSRTSLSLLLLLPPDPAWPGCMSHRPHVTRHLYPLVLLMFFLHHPRGSSASEFSSSACMFSFSFVPSGARPDTVKRVTMIVLCYKASISRTRFSSHAGLRGIGQRCKHDIKIDTARVLCNVIHVPVMSVVSSEFMFSYHPYHCLSKPPVASTLVFRPWSQRRKHRWPAWCLSFRNPQACRKRLQCTLRWCCHLPVSRCHTYDLLVCDFVSSVHQSSD